MNASPQSHTLLVCKHTLITPSLILVTVMDTSMFDMCMYPGCMNEILNLTSHSNRFRFNLATDLGLVLATYLDLNLATYLKDPDEGCGC